MDALWRVPPLAIVAQYSESCSGVNRLYDWPMAACSESPTYQFVFSSFFFTASVAIWPVLSGSSMPVCSPRPKAAA